MIGRRVSLIAALALGAVSLFGVDGASATLTHVFKGQFATETSDAQDLAVDNAGSIYVIDQPGRRILKYNSAGEPVNFSALGTNVLDGASQPAEQNPTNGFVFEGNSGAAVAIDNSAGPAAGEIYVTNNASREINVFSSAGAYLADLPVSFGEPLGVDVNTDGTVVVGDWSRLNVTKFTPTSADPTQDAVDGELTGLGFRPGYVAVDSTGAAYVSSWGSGPLVKFESGQFNNPENAIPSPFAPNPFAQPSLAFEVDPANDNIYVDAGGSVTPYTNGVSGAPAHPIGAAFGEGHMTSFSSRGIAIDDASDTIYVSDSNRVLKFGLTPAIIPDTTTGPVTNVGQTSGTLNGDVDPAGGGNVTSCEFEYGEDTSYSLGKLPCVPVPPYSSPTHVTAPISGLTSDVTYHYRLVAGNANGTNLSADATFTPHAVTGTETEPATAVTRTSAQLNGSFIGNGENTHYYFEWGTDTNYGNVTPEVDGGSPSGLTAEKFDLSALTLQTEYHYRFVARNSAGTSHGDDRSFITLAAVNGVTTEEPETTSTTAVLKGSFTGNGEDTQYFFEWGTDQGYGHVIPAPGADGGSEPGVHHVSAEISGLNPVSNYDYRLVASNAIGTTYGQDVHFETPASSPVLTQTVSDVTSDSAILHAQINPGGRLTKYHFEYGTEVEFLQSETYGHRIPQADVSVGGGIEFKPASAQLGGLEPGTVYHWRVVAENEIGVTNGTDRIFTTYPFTPVINDPCPNSLARQQASAAFLLDCRSYELVSAAHSGGYDVESDLVPGQSPFGGYPDASSPPRVLYAVHNGGIPNTGSPTNRGPDPYVATRGTDGWTTKYVGVPATDPFASAPFSSTPSAADQSLKTFAFGDADGCSPCFADGSTGIPVRNFAGLVQGMAGSLDPGAGATPDGLIAQPLSADGTHLVFGSTSRFEADGNNSTGDVSLYDRDLASGITHVISKSPAEANLTCLQGPGTCHSPGDGNGIAELGISADGSHIVIAQKVLTDADGNVYWHPYVNVDDSSRALDLAPGATGGVLYDGMTADGGKIFFTTKDRLLGADTDESADIYEADVGGTVALRLVTPSNADGCTPAANANGPHWNSVGTVANCDAVAIGGGGGIAGASGSIYFLSPEKLDGSKGILSQPNLYLSRTGASPRFIATLGPDDPVVLDSVKGVATRHTSDFQVTPDGEYAVFESTMPLPSGTHYDNAGFTEAYRYSAASGEVSCASCDPTGVEPLFDSSLARNGLSLTDDGRVFFDTKEPLAARDQDQKRDVYEWESGKVELISTGDSPFDSGLLTAGADGTDVYFFTRDTLDIRDQNGSLMKIYDAREMGGTLVIEPPPPCAASDECHGAGTEAPPPPTIKTIAGTPQAPLAQRKKHHHKPRHRKKKSHHRRHRNG